MTPKTKSKGSLAYIPGTAHCHLFNPGDKSIEKFEARYGFAKTIGSLCAGYPKKEIEIAGYWLVAFHRLVIKDRVNAVALHETLLQIPAFRNVLKKDWGIE